MFGKLSEYFNFDCQANVGTLLDDFWMAFDIVRGSSDDIWKTGCRFVDVSNTSGIAAGHSWAGLGTHPADVLEDYLLGNGCWESSV